MPVVGAGSVALGYTVADLIEATRRRLYGMHRGELNVLQNSTTAGTTTLVCTYSIAGIIGSGAQVAVGDELFYVLAADESTKTLTVLSAQMGSDAADHATGALIEINPIFPRFAIREELVNEIRSWSEDMFKVITIAPVTANGVQGYDLDGLTGDFYSILDVLVEPPLSSGTNAWIRPAYQSYRSAPIASFPSGAGILLTGMAPVEARTMQVVIAQPFNVATFDDATDLGSDVGLAASMLDIPPIGAAWRLMASRDVKRSMGEGQGEPRRAEEVPAGFAGSVSAGLRRLRDTRLSEEIAKLRGRYPYRFL